jgi:hypothetical protein
MSKFFSMALTVGAVASLMAVGAQAGVVKSAASADAQSASGTELVPSGKGWGVVPAKRASGTATRALTLKTTYHGGPVMADAGGVNTYFIWYGDWANQSPTGKAILTDMMNSAGGTPYFNINTTYYQNNSNTVANQVKNKVTLMGAIDDTAKSLGSALTDANIQTLVSNAISSGALPKDPNAVYFVLTTKDVNETSGFCTSYCGWHNHATILGTDIKYSFVGDAARCLSSCAGQSTSPNGNPGVDGMASVVMHELEEAATDPDLNAWYDRKGAENADKCAWTFGTTSTAPNGSKYNVTWGARQFYIQQNWVNSTSACALSH